MKKFKRGFTLAEVLFCTAIIGIVIALGAKVIQDSTERAYNKYIRTGYVNLHDVLRDPKYKSELIEKIDGNISDASIVNDIRNHIRDYFDPQRNYGTDNNNNIIHTNNGITYEVADRPYINHNFEGRKLSEDAVFPIIMTFPSSGRGATKRTCFLYIPNNGGVRSLVPVSRDDLDNMPPAIRQACNIDEGNMLELQDRAALLSFIVKGDNRKRSYRNAYCTTHSESMRIAITEDHVAPDLGAFILPLSWKNAYALTTDEGWLTLSTSEVQEKICPCNKTFYDNHKEQGKVCYGIFYSEQSPACVDNSYEQCIEVDDETFMCRNKNKSLGGGDDGNDPSLHFGGTPADPHIPDPCIMNPNAEGCGGGDDDGNDDDESGKQTGVWDPCDAEPNAEGCEKDPCEGKTGKELELCRCQQNGGGEACYCQVYGEEDDACKDPCEGKTGKELEYCQCQQNGGGEACYCQVYGEEDDACKDPCEQFEEGSPEYDACIGGGEPEDNGGGSITPSNPPGVNQRQQFNYTFWNPVDCGLGNGFHRDVLNNHRILVY